MKRNIPMYITFIRIILVPIILLLLELDTDLGKKWAIALFVVAAISDWLDGHLARKWNVTSTMGKYMDPIADKVLVSSLLVFFVAKGVIDPYLVMLLIGRDTLIGGIRSVAAVEGLVIAAGSLGKWKTALQMIALPLCMYDFTMMGLASVKSGYIILWISVALSLTSGFHYYFGYLRSNYKKQTST